MGPGQKIVLPEQQKFDPTRPGSKFLLLWSGRVGSAIFGLGMDLENFP